MREGWIKLHRSLLEWEWYDDIPTKCLFFHFLLSANHSPSKWRGITIGRGQMWTSIGSLSKQCGLTPKQVRIAIDKLENTGEVKSQGASNGTMITVCKYDTYQSFEDTEGKPQGKAGAKQGQGRGKVGATNNKNNNPKNDEENEEGKGVTAPPPPLEDVIAYFTENGYSEDAARKAWNYYNASLGENGRVWKDGKGQTVKNWKQKMQAVWFKDENKITQHAPRRLSF